MDKHYIENSNTTGHAKFSRHAKHTNWDMGLLHNIVNAILQKSKLMLYTSLQHFHVNWQGTLMHRKS